MRSIACTVLAACLAVPLAGTPTHASAFPLGPCVEPSAADRCDTWSAVFDETAPGGSRRSDEFPTATVASRTTAFTTYKHVVIDPLDAYAATSTWVVVAHDLRTGAVQWTASRQSRVYDSPLAVDVSHDRHHVVVTGSAYDAFPVSATDSRITTVSYDADTGAEEWSAVWDGRADGVDAGKTVRLSPDGSTVVVGGVTSVASGDLDYVLLGYDARTGEQLWSDTAGVPGRDDALFGLAVDGRAAYATGWGAATTGLTTATTSRWRSTSGTARAGGLRCTTGPRPASPTGPTR